MSDADVRHVAALARLGVSPTRIPQLVLELNGILAHMEVLQRAVPPEVEPMASATDRVGPARDDVAGADALEIPRESMAPVMRDGLFLVPRLAAHEDHG